MRYSIAFFCLFCLVNSITPADDTQKRKVSAPPTIKTGWDDVLDGVETRNDWQKKRQALRKRFLELIGDDAKPAIKPTLNLKVHETVDVEGVYARKLISYNVEPDQRAWAYLTVPAELKKSKRLPAIVALHGTGVEGKDIVAGFMPRPVHKGQGHLDELARRGYVVIAPDHFNMGQRLPPEGTYHTDIYGGSHASHRQRVLMNLRLTDVWALEGAAANFAFYVRAQGHSCQHDNNELMFAWLDKHLGRPRADLSRKVNK